MTSRQRGAAILLVALLAGRLLDRFDMPFEAPESTDSPHDALAPVGTPRTDPALVDTARASPRSSRPIAAATPTAPVAINRATARDLEALPGVGPVLAARIIAHREAHGRFADLTALRAVSGIGPRTATRLSPFLRFD